jgi:hypothetical protein
MKYAVETGSGAIIYIQSFIKSGPGVQKLMGRYTDPHRQQGYCISLLSFFFFFKISNVAENQPNDISNAFSNTPHRSLPPPPRIFEFNKNR